MTENPKSASIYRFGMFEAHRETGELMRKGVRIKLQEQPFQLLLLLLEKPAEIVSREWICQRLWPENTYVDFDASLSVSVGKLREALGDSASNPRFIETVPRRGYRFVAPVTTSETPDPVPEATPSVVSMTLPEAEKGSELIAIKPQPVRRFGRLQVIAAIAVAALLAAAIYLVRSSTRTGAGHAEAHSLAPSINVRRSVAILGFRNLPGRPEDKWLSAAFSEMLNTELGAGGELRMVSGEDVARAKSDLVLADEDTLAQATLHRLRTDPGADVVVLGSYTLLPEEKKIRLDLRIQDTAAGETIVEEALSGDENDLFELAEQAGQDLRRKLGLHPLSSEASVATRAAIPSDEKAARLYAEGREKLWNFDLVSARNLLSEAIKVAPDYPLAHSALADALWHSGYEAKARVEAKRAVDLSTSLSQEQKLMVEGTYRKTIGDWPRAVKTYQELFRTYPDSIDYGLLLASAQAWLKHADALQTLEALRRLPAPMGDDPRIDMTEASAWINTDFNRAQDSARRAIEKASGRGSHILVARTLGILCQQGPSLGNLEQGKKDCEDALKESIESHDVNGQSLMRTDLAAIYFEQGELKEAEKIFRQALSGFREVGNLSGSATVLSNLATVRLSLGDLPQARKSLKEAIPDYQAIGDKEGVALNLNNLGDLSRQNGNLKSAELYYSQAKATATEIDDKNAIAYVLSGQGDLLLDRGDLVKARQAYEECLRLRNEAGEKHFAAETEMALAQLSIEEGHSSEAATAARTLRKQFELEKATDDELMAGIVLVKALLGQAKVPEARHELDSNQTLAKNSQNYFARLQYALADARVKINSDRPVDSRPLLAQIDQDTQRLGYAGLRLENRLLQAQLTGKMHQPAKANAQLITIEDSARTAGYGLISSKAKMERNSPTL
ncbi:MAG: tetratricopeptide repeat protein [Acidobacteria bacterium]|nr:tetratricopeptide repeat protein [Acidobacteriota bacterium]